MGPGPFSPSPGASRSSPHFSPCASVQYPLRAASRALPAGRPSNALGTPWRHVRAASGPQAPPAIRPLSEPLSRGVCRNRDSVNPEA